MKLKRDLEATVREVFGEKRYVRNIAFNRPAVSRRGTLSSGAARNLVLALRKAGLVCSAGMGWSTVDDLGRFSYFEPIAELSRQLNEWFPCAESPCWSTHQLVDYFHHLPGLFYNYIYIDRSVMDLLRDKLQDRWPKAQVMVDPSKDEFRRARKAVENYVVRPIVRDDEIANAPCLPIEGILVDLAYEAEQIMDGWDYGEIVRQILKDYTIDPQAILRRIVRRRFVTGNMETLCEELFAEGIENESARKFYASLTSKRSS